MPGERCSPDHIPTAVFPKVGLIEPLVIRDIEISYMAPLPDFADGDRIIHLRDFVQRVVDGAMGEGSDKDAAAILHQQVRQVSEHEGLACTGWTLDKVEQVSRIRQCYRLKLTLIESRIL